MKPVILVTVGDPSGAGPEIALKALRDPAIAERCRPVLVGNRAVLERAASIVGETTPLRPCAGPRGYREGEIHYVDCAAPAGPYEFAKVQASCGEAAFVYVKKAIELALAGEGDAVVTGPLNKEALNLAGHHYAGHTEIFTDLTNAKGTAMLLTGGPLRVIHVCTHVSLREACDRIKKDRILRVIQLADEAARGLGVGAPRVGVLGLNPHSGEGGLFGREEIEEIVPAIQEARAQGIDAAGPLPPDTAFLHCKNGKYDIAVAMYHDQGHIPLKLLDFMGGVNITVGLPIIRTSVDHGTVFGKAGKGTADESSMIRAIEAAVQLTQHRKT
jgi:4-hydroxythreonine-4-phosphate dehydrogenase